MEDAIHRAAGALDGFLERVHGASDLFFEGVSHQDVIFFGITVIRTRPGEIVNPIECVVVAAGASRNVFVGENLRSLRVLHHAGMKILLKAGDNLIDLDQEG